MSKKTAALTKQVVAKKPPKELTAHPYAGLRKVVRRYHFTAAVLLVIVGLSIIVLFVVQLINDPTLDDGYRSPITAGSIDQDTLEEVNQLHFSTDRLPGPKLPSGRNNPFAE